MLVMKRYCDYDYDNGCIVLFDAEQLDDDQKLNEEEQDLNICWISSGEAVESDKNKRKRHIPLPIYLERKYEEKLQNDQKNNQHHFAYNNYSQSLYPVVPIVSNSTNDQWTNMKMQKQKMAQAMNPIYRVHQTHTIPRTITM